MFFCIKNDYFIILRDIHHFFSDEELLNNINDQQYVIDQKEVGLSSLVLKDGYNISCILPEYRGKDYRKINYNIDSSTNNTCGDPYFPNCYFGRTIKPIDVVFFKTNRYGIPI